MKCRKNILYVIHTGFKGINMKNYFMTILNPKFWCSYFQGYNKFRIYIARAKYVKLERPKTMVKMRGGV